MAKVGRSFQLMRQTMRTWDRIHKLRRNKAPDSDAVMESQRAWIRATPLLRQLNKKEARWIQSPGTRASVIPMWNQWHAYVRAGAAAVEKFPGLQGEMGSTIANTADIALSLAHEEAESEAKVSKRGKGPVKWKGPVLAIVGFAGAIYLAPILIPLLAGKRKRRR